MRKSHLLAALCASRHSLVAATQLAGGEPEEDRAENIVGVHGATSCVSGRMANAFHCHDTPAGARWIAAKTPQPRISRGLHAAFMNRSQKLRAPFIARGERSCQGWKTERERRASPRRPLMDKIAAVAAKNAE